MTRCESPNGAVEFSYNFPVASTSRAASASPIPIPTPRSPRRHAPSPLPPRWDDSDDEAEEEDESAEGQGTRSTLPVPTPTGNQWTRTPSPLPYASLTPSHLSPYDIAAGALPMAGSYESERSVGARHNKIRKPRFGCGRASVDEPPSAPPIATQHLAPPPPLSVSHSHSSGSSAPSSPFSVPSEDFSVSDDDAEDVPMAMDGIEEEEEDAEPDGEEHAHAHAHAHALKKQWAALSLRVRFGVFRAKRRMRSRVMSL